MKGTPVHIDCTYSKGMFDTEYAVLLSIADGKQVSLFADKRLVVINGKQHHGLLKVTAVDDVNEPIVNVLLPNETELGTRLVGIPRENLRTPA